MPAPINFFKAFEKGVLRSITMRNFDSARPQTGKRWLLLYGFWSHVTGSDTFAVVLKEPLIEPPAAPQASNLMCYLLHELAATGNGSYCLFNSGGDDVCLSTWQPIVLDDNMYINFYADNTAIFNFAVLEW